MVGWDRDIRRFAPSRRYPASQATAFCATVDLPETPACRGHRTAFADDGQIASLTLRARWIPLLLGAATLALWLRRRLFGPFCWTDVAIPLVLLTPAHYGIIMHAPNASHGAGPLFLLLLFSHALLIRDPRRRYAVLVALDFILVHTGFALFAGALTPLLLAISAYHA